MKKIIKQVCLSLFMGISAMGSAQVTWYFGQKAGIKFTRSSTLPSSTSLTALGNSAMDTPEGCATLMSDENELLMYSNGVTIWDRNHAPLSGVTLGGHTSGTQTVAIVPAPGTPGTRAFIFTVNAMETAYGNSNSNLGGLRVSVVDIDKSTGAITMRELNRQLTPGTGVMSEKLEVIRDNDGGFWVVTHGVGVYPGSSTNPGTAINNLAERRFYVCHVTTQSTDFASLTVQSYDFTSSPQIAPHQSFHHTTTGFSIDYNDYIINGVGQLKIQKMNNSNTAIIACTLPTAGMSATGGWTFDPLCQLYRFDLETGGISSPLQFRFGADQSKNDNKDGILLGLEMSPSGRYLYACGARVSGNQNNITPRIYQYDMSSWNDVQIPNSRHLVNIDPFPTSGPGFGHMQKGPDNNIYIAKPGQNSLARITAPDEAYNFCGFQINGFTLFSGTFSKVGLPATVLYTCPNPKFSTSINTDDAGFFTVTSTPNSYIGRGAPLYGFGWEVVEENASGTPLFTISPNNWWVYNTTPCTYKDFDQTNNNYQTYPAPNGYIESLPIIPLNPPNSAATNGKFLYGHRYKLMRTVVTQGCALNRSTILIQPTHKGVTSIIKNEDLEIDAITVYPNPSNGIFNVLLNYEEKATLIVYDVLGKVVKTVKLTQNDSKLDLSDQPKGVYMIKLSDNQQFTKRVVLE